MFSINFRDSEKEGDGRERKGKERNIHVTETHKLVASHTPPDQGARI